MSDIKIIALGGVRENAKNLYIVEINDSIFILDAGLKYPENEQLGVDFVIPNLDYLIENRDRIQGIFLTHGHADAIGALPYILQEVKAPVFGSSLTIELAKLFVKNAGVKKFNNFHVIDAETEIEFEDAEVSFFKTTHSIPESMGIVLGTDQGNIVYTGDFKFDQAARPYYKTDLGRLAEIGVKVFWPSCQTQQMRQVLNKQLLKQKWAKKLTKLLLMQKDVLLLLQLPQTWYVFNKSSIQLLITDVVLFLLVLT